MLQISEMSHFLPLFLSSCPLFPLSFPWIYNSLIHTYKEAGQPQVNWLLMQFIYHSSLCDHSESSDENNEVNEDTELKRSRERWWYGNKHRTEKHEEGYNTSQGHTRTQKRGQECSLHPLTFTAWGRGWLHYPTGFSDKKKNLSRSKKILFWG